MTQEDEAVAKVLRWGKAGRVVAWAAGLLIAAMLAISTYSLVALQQVQSSQKLEACRNAVSQRFFIGVADALNAPPAPNPARGIAVSEIKAAAGELHNLTSRCG